eukprot:6127560-Pleurochrysis_carterae.AAC.1
MRRSAKRASASLAAARAAIAARLALRLSIFALWRSTASRHVSWSQKSRSGQMLMKGTSFSRSSTVGGLRRGMPGPGSPYTD